MDRIEPELIRIFCPAFADVFVRGETLQRFEALGEVVGCQEGFEMLSKLIVGLVMIAAHGCFFQGAVHALDLAVGPGMVRFGEPVLDSVFPAAYIEHVGGVTRGWAIGVPWREGELNAVIGEHGMDFVGDRFDEGCQEGRRGHAICFFSELGEGEFAGPVDGHEEEELSLRGLHLGDVDMEEADRICLERFLGRLVAFGIRQPADAVRTVLLPQRFIRRLFENAS